MAKRTRRRKPARGVYLSVRDIAQECDVKDYRINYLISRMRVPEAKRIGITRVYDLEAVERIKSYLRQKRSLQELVQ